MASLEVSSTEPKSEGAAGPEGRKEALTAKARFYQGIVNSRAGGARGHGQAPEGRDSPAAAHPYHAIMREAADTRNGLYKSAATQQALAALRSLPQEADSSDTPEAPCPGSISTMRLLVQEGLVTGSTSAAGAALGIAKTLRQVRDSSSARDRAETSAAGATCSKIGDFSDIPNGDDSASGADGELMPARVKVGPSGNRIGLEEWDMGGVGLRHHARLLASYGLPATTAARTHGGNYLMSVPQPAADIHNASATHPSVDGGRGYDAIFLLRGDVQPPESGITEQQDAALKANLAALQAETSAQQLLARRTTLIQSLVRMRIARQRFLIWRDRLRKDVGLVLLQRQARCATLIQKNARRLLWQHRYLRFRLFSWQRLAEGGRGGRPTGMEVFTTALAAAHGRNGLLCPSSTAPASRGKQGKKYDSKNTSFRGGTPGGQQFQQMRALPLPPAPYPWCRGIVERHSIFLTGLRLYTAGQIEEARPGLELLASGTPPDKVAGRLAARITAALSVASGGQLGAGPAPVPTKRVLSGGKKSGKS